LLSPFQEYLVLHNICYHILFFNSFGNFFDFFVFFDSGVKDAATIDRLSRIGNNGFCA